MALHLTICKTTPTYLPVKMEMGRPVPGLGSSLVDSRPISEVMCWAISSKGYELSNPMCYHDKIQDLNDNTLRLFFVERTVKTLPWFLLDEERKKGKWPPSFLNGNWAKKSYNRGECSTHPIQLWYSNRTTIKTHAPTCSNLVESTQLTTNKD